MTDGDPPPLKSAEGTPPELVRALREMGRDDLDAARLGRVAERLSASLAGPAAPPASWLRRLLGTKLGLSGLIAGVGALGLLVYALIAYRTAPAAEAPAAPAPAASDAPRAPSPALPREPERADAPAPQAEPPAAASPQGQPPAAPARSRSPVQPRGANGHGRATGESRTAAKVPSSAATTPETGAATPSESAATNAPEQAPASTDEAQAQPQPAPAEAKPPVAPSAAKAQPSEVALLHQARNLASEQPEEALRLLDDHAKRFPNGILVPEREVLAIEVLRRLGRDAEADRRLRKFEARYPQSIHLRRLERGAPATNAP